MTPDVEPTAHAYRPTTTHAMWGAGHPRLLVTSEVERFVHEIDCDLTHVGSAEESEVLLEGTDPLHAKIMHDSGDEFVLKMVGKGNTSHGPDATLRTGSHFTAGPWRLVYARDEYGDHGRPYGGRNGGEFAHQRRQGPRPDYAAEHPAGVPIRCELKPADQSTDAQHLHALRHSVLTGATSDRTPEVREEGSAEIRVVNDEAAGVYGAVLDGREIGGVTYNLLGDDRIVLLAVSVFPQFRGRGVATALIHSVLDDVHAQGRTITNYCPVVADFIAEHPEYAVLIDKEHPGAYTARHHG